MPTARATPLSSIKTPYFFKGNTVNVFFSPEGFSAPEDDSISPGTPMAPVSEGFNAYERAQFRAAFDMIEQYIDLSFETVSNRRGADFSLVLDTNQFTGSTLGYFYLPNGAEQYGVFNGKRWDRTPGGDLEVGGKGFVTIVHEVLHGLGLGHPHSSGLSDRMDGVTSAFNDYGTADLNQGIYTTMTYNDGYRTGSVGSKALLGAIYGNQAGPMALDIAVLQEIYGANTNTNAGDTVYTLDGSNDVGTHWSAIWDVGGLDTIVVRGNRDAVIDLRAATLEYEEGGGGFVSTAKKVAGGFTIAAGVVIENAGGGNGSDVLRGNDAHNALSGGAGNDTLTGGGGADRLAGGSDRDVLFGKNGADRLAGESGNDVLFGNVGNDRLFGGPGADRLNGGVGADTLTGGNGTDTVVGWSGRDVLFGRDGADRLEAGSGNDVLFGNGGNDRLFGGAGADRLNGGVGADTLNGGNGTDTLVGWFGDDVLFGNGGADEFVFEAGGGQDTIMDLGRGDRVSLDAGLVGSAALGRFASVVASDLALDFGGGDVLVFFGYDSVGQIAGQFDFL